MTNKEGQMGELMCYVVLLLVKIQTSLEIFGEAFLEAHIINFYLKEFVNGLSY